MGRAAQWIVWWIEYMRHREASPQHLVRIVNHPISSHLASTQEARGGR